MALNSIKISHAGPFRPSPETDVDGDQSGPVANSFATGPEAGQFRESTEQMVDPDPVEIILDDHVNLFIGPNNSGKTTVLRALRVLTSEFESIPQSLVDWDHYFQSCYLSTVWNEGRIVLQWVGGTMSANFEDVDSENPPDRWNDFVKQHGYIAFHNIAFQYDPIDDEDPYSVIKDLNEDFYNAMMPHISDTYGWETPILMTIYNNFDDLDINQSSAFEDIVNIISEVTEGYSIDLTSQITFQTHGSPDGIAKWQYVANTIDGRVRTTDFSQGTRSIVDWAFRIMFCMALYYDFEPGWKDLPGIFVIDEIDAHLHPSWQRRIIPALRRHFPNVQIFASTHSPMMVVGLRTGQVHLLKRNDAGRVVWSRNEQDIIGWTADEIYRTFMEIEDPTDEQTAQHAEELRELREKETLTRDEENRLEELERLVDEDLAAGGWKTAQDHRFDEILRRVLSSRLSDTDAESG